MSLITASNAIQTGSINPSLDSGILTLGNTQIAGTLNLGTNVSRTGDVNIGTSTNTGKITIATVNTGNTNADPAISIGADAGAKTIKINNNTQSVHCSSVDLKGSTINNITATTGALSVGDGQTDGVLNLGTNSARTATGVINIGSSTGLAPINIDTASTLNTNASPAISIGTAVSAKTIKIGHNNSATRGIVNVGELKVDTGQTDVKLETQGTNNQMYIGSQQSSGILYIASAGATRSGAVNISSNAGTFETNIHSGSSSGTLTLGSSSNSINILSSSVNITSSATGNVTIGANHTTGGNINLATSTSSVGVLNIGNGQTSNYTINMINGNTNAGTVNIATGTAGTQSSVVNISSGTTTGALTLGNTNNTVKIGGTLAMGASKSITLRTDGTAPTAQTQLGGRIIQSIVPSLATANGFIYSTITITTPGVYLFEFLVEQAYTSLGSNNYITINGANAEVVTNGSVSRKYGWNPTLASTISFQGSQVTTATASNYTIVVTHNSTYSTAGIGFFQVTRLG